MSDVPIYGEYALRAAEVFRETAELHGRRFPFFSHLTLAEVDEAARLRGLYQKGTIAPYQMARLKELGQRRG